MTNFINNSNLTPFIIFRKKFDAAMIAKQESIDAICISSFSKTSNIVDARFVNLKFVDNENFIFFTNYKSKKSLQIAEHSQISATLYWHTTNTQIRIKANIKKTDNLYNQEYFSRRSSEKNALAISSNQSEKISTYNDVSKKYKVVRDSQNLSICPDYWGGYAFKPFYFEFWKGHESRLNERIVFDKVGKSWIKYILEP
jgi:pyridoxamine 5'-phosphate oxidase